MTKVFITLVIVTMGSAGCSADDCTTAAGAMSEGVPFFSAQGQKLRELCAIPPPPIAKKTLADAEPTRAKGARDWSSPFCLAWTDATQRCSREAGAPSCRPLAGPEQNRVGKVVCVKADVEALKRGCAELNMTQDDHYTDGSVDAFDFEGNPSWSYSLAAHAWDVSVDGDNRVVPAYRGAPRQLAYSAKDSVCLKTFTGGADDPVVVEK